MKKALLHTNNVNAMVSAGSKGNAINVRTHHCYSTQPRARAPMLVTVSLCVALLSLTHTLCVWLLCRLFLPATTDLSDYCVSSSARLTASLILKLRL